jgi:TorA maturation chaperone TorD
MGAEGTEPARIGEVDAARAHLYALLGQLLARPPAQAVLDRVAGLRGAGGTLGDAIDDLAAGAAAGEAAVRREFDALFIGLDRGELVPYASYYLTGFLNGRPLAHLRRDLEVLGVGRLPGVAEPEDHIALLCETMAGLIAGTIAPAAGMDEEAFFRRHLAPWAERFFSDLERARAAVFYRPLGRLGRLFTSIEAQAWAMAAEAGDEPATSAMAEGGQGEGGEPWPRTSVSAASSGAGS